MSPILSLKIIPGEKDNFSALETFADALYKFINVCMYV